MPWKNRNPMRFHRKLRRCCTAQPVLDSHTQRIWLVPYLWKNCPRNGTKEACSPLPAQLHWQAQGKCKEGDNAYGPPDHSPSFACPPLSQAAAYRLRLCHLRQTDCGTGEVRVVEAWRRSSVPWCLTLRCTYTYISSHDHPYTHPSPHQVKTGY
jgi:hypothetical protein